MASTSLKKTYLILGASRGIGLELVTQLLSQNHIVIATQRASTKPSPLLKKLSETHAQKEYLTILNCDVSDKENITRFVGEVGALGEDGGVLAGMRGDGEKGGKALIDTVIFNAGILEYPARVSELYVHSL
jgi:NAD(P)-dependent dehydrogenase (short-subunit alcohol dehydrogenase family)